MCRSRQGSARRQNCFDACLLGPRIEAQPLRHQTCTGTWSNWSEKSMTFQTLGHPAISCRGVSFTLSVSSLDGLHSVNLPNVFSIENIPINPNVILAKGLLNTMPHLSGITFQRYQMQP